MRPTFHRTALKLAFAMSLAAGAAPAQQAQQTQQQGPALSIDQQELFLKKAKIKTTKGVSKGITQTSRVTLTDGVTTHDASVQTIDEFKQVFSPQAGKPEFNFKDTYKFNIAAWKLGRMIGLEGMIPPSVDRGNNGKSGSYTWWIDNVQMDEGERQKKNATAPDQQTWKQDYAILTMFDQLIENKDRNVGNIQIDNNWRIWMIDHTRAFRTSKEPPNLASLTMIDRNVLAKLKQLNETVLLKELKSVLTRTEIQSMLVRRDTIVKAFESKGESALFTMKPRN